MKPAMIAALLALLLAVLPGALADEYHITLLTVGENGDGFIGGTADAYLEIEPGTGRIFLDSFPLTKLDTQISTRYANKIACDYLDMNCNRYDFFYTIRADSTIVGGPSASAPLTILTIAALKGSRLKNDTVLTGTINSGGSIGPVGGILSKAEAAQKAGFTNLLVPRFAIISEEPVENKSEPVITRINVSTSSNISIRPDGSTVVDIGETGSRQNQSGLPNLTINVIRVSNLDEAVPYFLDLDIARPDREIVVPPEYVDAMRDVAVLLCEKAGSLKDRLALNASDANKTAEFEAKINVSMQEQNYYSAASFCFNMGVLLRKINLRQIEASDPEMIGRIANKTLEAANDMDSRLEAKNITTLPELETYIIVKERLVEAQGIITAGNGNLSSSELAYALERYYSAVHWSSFFRVSGKPINLEPEHLEEACYKKISEAEERINYADLYLPSTIGSSRSELKDAYGFSKAGNFKMCLFKASFAKAEANLLLSSIAVQDDKFSELALEKLSSVHKLVAREAERGFFPIMGYSYYEYALSLSRNGDEVSSLIFAEYSLELSNLEIYFPKSQAYLPAIGRDLALLIASVFFFGFFSGALVAFGHVKRLITSKKLKITSKRRK